MNFLISWVLGLFQKPKEEIDPKATAWAFPVVSEDFNPRPKKKPAVKKPAVKKPAAKKVAVKKTVKKVK